MTVTVTVSMDAHIGSKAERMTVPIADLPDWAFWTRVRLLALSPEEQAQLVSGTMPDEKAAQIKPTLELARIALRDMPVPGVQDWMPPRRYAS